jgi:hypothetical protein
MKSLVAVCLYMFCVVNQFCVDRTYTIDAATMSAIRSCCRPAADDPYIHAAYAHRADRESESTPRLASVPWPLHGTNRLSNMFESVILDDNNSLSTINDLVNTTISEVYIGDTESPGSLVHLIYNTDHDYNFNGEHYRDYWRGDLTWYYLANLSLILDLSYYYISQDQREALSSKLDTLSVFCSSNYC